MIRIRDVRTDLLRAVLVVYAAGHLVTATLFVAWPGYFIDATGPAPPWPFTLAYFGAWPPLHQGFMNVLASYDVAVAVALLIAARDPRRHTGVIAFAIVLWTLHGAVHAYHILFGSSPAGYWWAVAELWAGAVLLVLLARPAGRRERDAGVGSSAVR